jgi:type IV pilus assembly protein PilO
MKKIELNIDSLKIDFSKVQKDQPGTWPIPLKGIIFLLVIGLVVFLANYIFINDKKITLSTAVNEEVTLKADFEKKAFQAKNLEQLRLQMIQATETLGALLKQLPSKTEVPALLEDITKTGLGSGLEFTSIKLLPETKVQFYTELPISINVKGGYHDLATFISAISALSRIVTVHDYKLKPVGDDGLITMSITAKTYRADTVDMDFLKEDIDKKAATENTTSPKDSKSEDKK